MGSKRKYTDVERLERKVLATKIYNDKHREAVRKRNRENHRKNKERDNLKKKGKQDGYRKIVLEHYIPICACCGETRNEFLTVDHIAGGGRQHRKETHGHLCEWLVKHNFPEGFRILCMNCNFSLGMRGYCPHTNEKELIKS